MEGHARDAGVGGRRGGSAAIHRNEDPTAEEKARISRLRSRNANDDLGKIDSADAEDELRRSAHLAAWSERAATDLPRIRAEAAATASPEIREALTRYADTLEQAVPRLRKVAAEILAKQRAWIEETEANVRAPR